MAWWRRQSGDDHVGTLAEDRPSYIPPTRRKRIIRVRWYAPIAIAAAIAGFVIFVVSGPDYNQRLVLERADGTTHEVCAARTIVGDGGIEPREDGTLPSSNAAGTVTWLDADPPSELQITGGGLITYFDEDGRAFDRVKGEPWTSALVEPPGTASGPYVSLDARGGC